MDGAVWILIKVPVHLLEGKEGIPIQDQVSLGWLWWTAYANGSRNDTNGTRSLRL
jgi:hypothetical protein